MEINGGKLFIMEINYGDRSGEIMETNYGDKTLFIMEWRVHI